jgi:hypothetical protein
VSVVVEYGPPSVEKALGALPVVRDVLARLDLVSVVDRLCPVRDIARVSHDEAIAVVANRLTSPTPLLHVEQWARAWAVEEMFGLPADALNDDRVGRALDALAEQCEAVVGSIGAAAIAAYGIDVARIHWDMTSISLYGDYPEIDDDYAAPQFGHPKDRRPDLKQVQIGLAVTGDGGIPLLARAFDGGAAEVCQVTTAMRALREVAGVRRFLLVGDSKFVSYANLTALHAADVDFLAPAPKSAVPSAVLAGLDWGERAPGRRSRRRRRLYQAARPRRPGTPPVRSRGPGRSPPPADGHPVRPSAGATRPRTAGRRRPGAGRARRHRARHSAVLPPPPAGRP